MCKNRFSEYVLKRLSSDKEKFNLQHIEIENCPCLWDCKNWPNVVFDWKKENFCDPAKASKIMFEKISHRKNSKKD